MELRIANIASLLGAVLLVAGGVPPAEAREEKGEWVNLLAGDSLEHWEPGPSKAKNPRREIGNRWSLNDGVLHLDRDAESGRGGQIWTKKKYDNFDLKFEFRISHDGNSGVKYRAADVEGRAIGCEYQIIDDDNYRDNKNPTHRTACLYELVAVPADRKWNPAGQWNEGRIRVSGNRFEHWLNGEKVVSIEFGSADWNERFARSKYRVHPGFAQQAGPIVLTDHGDTVSYRNVYLRELAAPPEKTKAPAAGAAGSPAEPLAFTTNCKACHLLDRVVVGPSLVEIAELYPRNNRSTFIQWCIEPDKRRDHMPQMPSMAHVPREELIDIYEYIKEATVGVKRVASSRVDPYATAPATTRRPRIVRTFVPEAGPASLILALPTPEKHNVIWDTDQCRLRYISVGEPDNYPYLKSNGNALAKVGKIIHRAGDPVFPSADPHFMGYRVSREGFPSFLYRIGDSEITETISASGNEITRHLEATPEMPDALLPGGHSTKLKVSATRSGNSLSIVYTAE